MKHNRKPLLSLLALGFLLSCTQAPKQIAENATVLIVHKNADGSIGHGSGFFVKSDEIVTNIHIVVDSTIVFAVGTKNVYTITGVVGSEPEQDLVILQVSGKGKPLSLGNGRIGEEVFAVGYPGGGYKVTEGTIHNIRAQELLLVSKNGGPVLAQGNSGGPVLNHEGEAIGVATGVDKFGIISVASSSKTVRELLEHPGPAATLLKWQQKPEILAFSYHRQANAKQANREYETAIQYYNEALKRIQYARLHYDRGNANRERGDYKAAIEDYNKAIGLKLNYAAAYHNRGLAQFHLGDYQAAIEDYKKTIRVLC